jgi:hypothetical protein
MQRRSSAKRGLGANYRRQREQLAPPRPGQTCPRCTQPILPGQPVDAGHAQDRALRGMMSELRWEHATWNRGAGGKLAQVLAKTRRMGGGKLIRLEGVILGGRSKTCM